MVDFYLDWLDELVDRRDYSVRLGGTKAPMCEPLIAAETLLRCKGYSHPLSNLRSAADTRSAGVAIIPDPPHGRAAARELVAIGLAVHPRRPLLAELIFSYPPIAGI